MGWIVEFLNEQVEAILNDMPVDIRASFSRIAHLIGDFELENVRERT